MNQTNHFFDLGYGWLCKHCSAADTESKHSHAGFLSHVDKQKDQSKPFALTLASWTDASHHVLTCPRCGIEELITN